MTFYVVPRSGLGQTPPLKNTATFAQIRHRFFFLPRLPFFFLASASATSRRCSSAD